MDGAEVDDHVVACVRHRQRGDGGDRHQRASPETPLRQADHHRVEVDPVHVEGACLADQLHPDAAAATNLPDATAVKRPAKTTKGKEQVASPHEDALPAVEGPPPKGVHAHRPIEAPGRARQPLDERR
jgi:hypothetical protein